MNGKGNVIALGDMSLPGGMQADAQQFSIGESLNFVSHDLRSPLVSILSLVEKADRPDSLQRI